MKLQQVSSLVLALGLAACSNAHGKVPSRLSADPSQTPGEAAPSPALPHRSNTLTIDASSKTDFQYFALDQGKLTPATLADNWIFGVRRYIFQTPTGSNGPFAGGAYGEALAGYDAFSSCATSEFKSDEVISMLGYTISANSLLSNWYDYNDEGAIEPSANFWVIARDADCLKIKILSYTAGVYEIEYSQIPQ